MRIVNTKLGQLVLTEHDTSDMYLIVIVAPSGRYELDYVDINLRDESYDTLTPETIEAIVRERMN